MSSQQIGPTVSLATGVLEYQPGSPLLTPEVFTGELVQRFSNQEEHDTSPVVSQPNGGDDDGHPSDPLPHLPNQLRVTITGHGGIQEMHFTVRISLLSQRNPEFSFEPQCLAGVMYGVGRVDGAPPGVLVREALYVVSLGNRRYVANA